MADNSSTSLSISSAGVTHWLKAYRDGDPLAAQRLWEEFAEPLRQLARRNVAPKHRIVSDEEDIAISAFKSFFMGCDVGKFDRVVSRGQVWTLLAALATHKALDHVRYQTRVRRTPQSVNPTTDDDPATVEEVADQGPTPEQVVAFEEFRQRLIDELRDATLRSIVQLRLEGKTAAEIAAHLGCAVRTVERKVAIIRQLWEPIVS
jgi:RNA polymerase sigma factor (sigma-70 family)